MRPALVVCVGCPVVVLVMITAAWWASQQRQPPPPLPDGVPIARRCNLAPSFAPRRGNPPASPESRDLDPAPYDPPAAASTVASDPAGGGTGAGGSVGGDPD
eukprot:gene11050-9645_t